MSAVVQVESGGNPLALHDNTLRQSYAPESQAEAIDWATQLIGFGHSVDLGLSQINSANLPMLAMSVAQAFDPCTNLRGGARILGEDYTAAAGRFGPGQYALRRALAAYNSGSFFASQAYVNEILVAAGVPPETAEAPTTGTAGQSNGRGKRAAPQPTPEPPYTIERVAGSPVVVIDGTP